MYNKIFKLTILFLILLGFNFEARACYFSPYAVDYIGQYGYLVNPNLLQDKSLTYFVPYDYTSTQWPENSTQNIYLWRDYLNPNLPYQDVYQLVYDFTEKDLQDISAKIKGKNAKLAPKVAANAMTKWLIEMKSQEVVDYLVFAKKMERVMDTVTTNTAWGKTSGASERMPIFVSTILSVKSPFLRERYAFQLLRWAAYGNKHKLVLSLYDQLYASQKFPPNVVSGWIEGLLGKAYWGLDRNEDAVYQWVKMYTLAPEKYVAATQGYMWSDKNYQDIVGKCKSIEERRSLALMSGISPSVWDIQNVTTLFMGDVNNPVLEMICMKSILNYEFDTSLVDIPRVQNACSTIGAAVQSTRKNFWAALTSAAAILAGDAKTSAELIQKWKRSYPDSVMTTQWEVLNLVHQSRFGTNADVKTAAAEAYPYLESDQNWADHINYYYVGPRFAKEHDTTMLFVTYMGTVERNLINWDTEKTYRNYVNRYAVMHYSVAADLIEKMSDEAILKLYDDLEKNKNDKFYKSYALDIMNTDVLLEYMGMRYARQLRWDDAESVMSRMHSLSDNSLPASAKLIVDPFADVYSVQKYRPNTVSGGMGTMTRLDAVKAIKAKKQAADKGDAQAAYEYASALYNASFWGHNWLLMDFIWSSVDADNYFDGFDYRPQRWKTPDEFFELNEAKAYALKAGKKRKLRDDAYYMAALCDQAHYSKGLNDWYASEENSKKFHDLCVNNPYFKKINKKNTRLIKYCDYFDDYVKSL